MIFTVHRNLAHTAFLLAASVSKIAGAAGNRTRDLVLIGAMPQRILTRNAVAVVDGPGLLVNMRPKDFGRCYYYKKSIA